MGQNIISYEGYQLIEEVIPKHIAIIMDGNRRWAKNNKMSSFSGHQKGLDTVLNVLEACEDLNVKILTIYAFSIENWKRTKEEIDALMRLFEFFFDKQFKKLMEKNVRVVHSGIRDNLSKRTLKILDTIVEESKNNIGQILNFAFNYSGREEIIQSVKRFLTDMEEKNKTILNAKEIFNEKTFSQYLDNSFLPEPELMIRTSGEMRISNFLIWEIAYSELWFTDTLWPDFSKKEFAKAIYDYQNRIRRFGE